MKRNTLTALWLVAVSLVLAASGELTPVLSLSGSASYVDLGTKSSLQIPSDGPYTVEAWVLLRATDIANNFYTKNSGRTPTRTYFHGVDRLRMTAYGSASGANVLDDVLPLALHRWHHYAWSFDGTEMSFYFDGVHCGSKPHSFVNTTEHSAKIGGYQNDRDFNGKISELRLWNYARSEAEVKAGMGSRLSGSEAGLKGYWKLNQASGNVNDSSGNGNSGTRYNATWSTTHALPLAEYAAGVTNLPPFTLADPESGSRYLTRQTTLLVTPCEIPAAATHYQLTAATMPDAIDPAGWDDVEALSATLSFDTPAADTNLLFALWFTDNERETLWRSVGAITYTTVGVIATARSTPRPLAVTRFPAKIPTAIIGGTFNAGTTGGTTEPVDLALRRAMLRLSGGPSSDTTPEADYVTISQPGEYELDLIAHSEIGNVATTATAIVSVTAESGEPHLQFNGINRYVNLGAGHVTGLADCTISAWIKTSTQPASGKFAAIAGSGFMGNDKGVGLYINNGGSVVMRGSDGVNVAAAAMAYPFDGKWHHVVGVREHVYTRFYFDGQLVSSTLGGLNGFTTTYNFAIGAYHSGGGNWTHYFNGSIAEVTLWKRALQPEEVAAMMHQRLLGTEDGLIGYWPLNDGTGAIANGVNLQPRHGTIVNATWGFDPDLTFIDDEVTTLIPFELENIVTGSRLFTNSNEVDVVNLTWPEGYDLCQFSQSETRAPLSPEAWYDAEHRPTRLLFAKPPADTNITWYAWFSNSTAQATLARSSSTIGYTTAKPISLATTALFRRIQDGGTTLVEPVAVDNGSTGGAALGLNLAIHSRQLHIANGPAPDATPEADAVTFTMAGVYDIELIVRNIAGNVATSALCQITVTADAKPFLIFNGANSYVDMKSGKLDGQTDLTLAAWVRVTQLPTDLAGLAGHGYLGTTDGYCLYMNSGGTVAFQPRNRVGGQNYWLSPGAAFPIGSAWHHVAGVRRGDENLLYLDGQLVDRKFILFPNAFNTSLPFSVGALYTTEWIRFFKGDIAEVQLWDYALSGPAVRDAMRTRAYGGDEGLRGYWPFDEGDGPYAYDYAGGNVTGELVRAVWSADLALAEAVPRAADYIGAAPFTLSDTLSGSTRFTAALTVAATAFPTPTGMTHYQITTAPTSETLNEIAWSPVSGPPATLTAPLAEGDTNFVWFAWFTNMSEQVVLRRAIGDIIYAASLPQAAVIADYSRLLIPDSPLAIYPAEVDDGSRGASVFGEEVPLKGLRLICLNGPEVDTTPAEPYVTLTSTGNYDLALVAEDILGHVATSSICHVEVAAWGGEQFVWVGTDDNMWANPRNWDLLGVPPADAAVVIAAGANIRLAGETPGLASFTMNGGLLTFSGATAKLHATTIELNNGTVSHTANTPTAAEVSGEWAIDGRVWFECAAFTLGAAASIDVAGRGYVGGAAESGAGPGGGAVGAGPNNTFSGGGAGHGGHGGQYPERGVGGIAYGDRKAPVTPGSGGGGRLALATAGGAGGGLVRIIASDTMTVDGVITANGLNGANTNAGGGSGGGIWLTARLLAGRGAVTANGGNGGATAGAGSGGRVALWHNAGQPQATLTATAAAGTSGGLNDLEPGTVYWRKINGTLLLIR